MGAYGNLRNLVLILSWPAAAENAVVSSDGHSIVQSVKQEGKHLKPTSALVRGATDAAAIDADVEQEHAVAESQVRLEAQDEAGSLAETGAELAAGMQLGLVTLIEELDGSAYQLSEMPTQVGDTIGSGTYGAVWKGRMAGREELVAVKVFHGGESPDEDESTGCAYQNLLRRKAELLGYPMCVPECIMDCSHAMDTALSLEARSGCAQGKYYLVMDLAPGVSLRSTLKGRASAPLSMANVQSDEFNAALRSKVAAELLTCVDLLGTEQHDDKGDLPVILHRDLKPDNFHLTATGTTAADLDVDLTMLDLGLALPLLPSYQFHDNNGQADKKVHIPEEGINRYRWASNAPKHLRGKYATAPTYHVYDDDALALEGQYWVCRAWSCTNVISVHCLMFGRGACKNDNCCLSDRVTSCERESRMQEKCQINLAELQDPKSGSGVWSVQKDMSIGTLTRDPANPWLRASAAKGQLAHSGPFHYFGYPTAPPAACFTRVQAEASPADVSGFDVFSVGAVDYMIWCVNFHQQTGAVMSQPSRNRASFTFDWCERRMMNYIFDFENNRVNRGLMNDASRGEPSFDQKKASTWPVGTYLSVGGYATSCADAMCTRLSTGSTASKYLSGTDYRFLGLRGEDCVIAQTQRQSSQVTSRTFLSEGCAAVTIALQTGEAMRGFRSSETLTHLWQEVNHVDQELSVVPGALQAGTKRPSAKQLLGAMAPVQVHGDDARGSAAPSAPGRVSQSTAYARPSTMAGRHSYHPTATGRQSVATGGFGQRHGNVPNGRAGSTAVRPNYGRVSNTVYKSDGTRYSNV